MSDDDTVTVTMRIPRGAKNYLLALAKAHNACNRRKGRQQPSLQVLARLIASGNIKTLKAFDIAEVDVPTYPFNN